MEVRRRRFGQCFGWGSIVGVVRGSKGGREELKHDSKMLTAPTPPPDLAPSLRLNQFLLCFFVIWGQLGGFGVILRSRSAAFFFFVMFSSLSLGVECRVSVVVVLGCVSCCCGSSIGCCGGSV